jgi:hypothetical protein
MHELAPDIITEFRSIVATATHPLRSPSRLDASVTLDMVLPDGTISFTRHQHLRRVRFLQDEIMAVDLVSESTDAPYLTQRTTFRDQQAEKNTMLPHAPAVSFDRVIDEEDLLWRAVRIARSPHLAYSDIGFLAQLDDKGSQLLNSWLGANLSATRQEREYVQSVRDARRTNSQLASRGPLPTGNRRRFPGVS